MQTFIAQTKRTGDCIVITIPKEALEAEQIKTDTFVRVTVQKVQQQTTSTRKTDDSLGPDDPWKLLE